MFSFEEIVNAVNGKIINSTEKMINNISINSTNIELDALFIPIKGEKHDGNSFIVDAVNNGVVASLIDSNYKEKDLIIDKCKNKNIGLIEVDDTLKALQDLAHYNRIKNKNTIVIGITGSNGKTSTKELIYDILKYNYNVLKTDGNLNNHIGLPLTLLKLNKHDICILEMGMNHSGEIKLLSNIAQPDMAIITNVGTAHIGLLGSKENILKAKMEVTSGLKENGVLFINNEDKLLKEVPLNSHYTIYRYGYNSNIKLKNKNKLKIENRIINLSKVGEYPINIVLTYYIAKYFDIELKTFVKQLKLHTSPKMRMNEIKIKNNIIIDDSYNANYDSMKNGIESVINKYGKKYNILLYLGDMLELGEWSTYYHRKIGKLIVKYKDKIDVLYLTGNDIKYIYAENKDNNIIKKIIDTNCCTEIISDDIINLLDNYSSSVIYFKGSRKLELDKIANQLIRKLQDK